MLKKLQTYNFQLFQQLKEGKLHTNTCQATQFAGFHLGVNLLLPGVMNQV